MENTIIESLKPKPILFVPKTEESRIFYAVSDALHRVGIHGDDNTIETCETLGIKYCCDKNSPI